MISLTLEVRNQLNFHGFALNVSRPTSRRD
jgi:lipoate-protein ligase B